MVITNTKRAAERRLASITPNDIPTAYESVNFDPPTTIYQRTQFVLRRPDDPVIGTGYYRENIQFQVFIVDKSNEGTARAIERAEVIRQQFAKGTVMIENGTRIHVLSTPQIAGSTVVQGRLVVPVLIDLVAEVYSQ